MLRPSNQIFIAFSAVFLVLFISTLGVPAFAQGRGLPITDHNVSGTVVPGLGSGDAVGTEGSPGTPGTNRSPSRANDSEWIGSASVAPEAGLIGNTGGAGVAGGKGASLTLTVVGDADFSDYTVLGSTGGLAGAGGQGGLGQAGGHGAYTQRYLHIFLDTLLRSSVLPIFDKLGMRAVV